MGFNSTRVAAFVMLAGFMAASPLRGYAGVPDYSSISSNVQPVQDLQMAIVVWRHGDRSPLSAYPTQGPDAEKAWPDGFNQLTPQGIQQHYQLGQYLHKRYSALLKGIIKNQEGSRGGPFRTKAHHPNGGTEKRSGIFCRHLQTEVIDKFVSGIRPWRFLEFSSDSVSYQEGDFVQLSCGREGIWLWFESRSPLFLENGESNSGFVFPPIYMPKTDENFIANSPTFLVYVQSSAKARTLMSGAANLAGFFPPTEKMGMWNSNDPLSSIWQPMPIFSRAIDRESVFSIAPCPASVEQQQFPPSLAAELGYTDLMNFVANKTGLALDTFPMSFYRVNDILYCQGQHGHSQPSWATPSVQKQIKFWADATLRLVQGGRKGDKSIQRQKMRGGVMMELIMEALARRANGSVTGNIFSDDIKLFAYSGHDVNIAALMAILQLFDYDNANKSPLTAIPEYASSIYFELFKNNTVRIVLRNNAPEDFSAAPVVVKHPKCDVFCPINKLIELTKPYFMAETDWFAACKQTIDPKFDITKYSFTI